MQKRKRIWSTSFWLLALTVVFLAGTAGTIAYTTHNAFVDNALRSYTVGVEIKEPVVDNLTDMNDGTPKTKQVQFKNTGTAPAFLRVTYAETLVEDGYWKPLTATDVTKNWTSAWASDWVNGGDGWYYYNKVLAPGAETARILNSIQFNKTVEKAGDYNLDFIVEAVQVSDEAAVNTAATQAAFLKTGTVTNMVVNADGRVTSGGVSWS